MKLSKVYEPAEYEGDIYALWEKTEAFVPKNRGDDASFTIVIPPPNANGDLHIGHALTLGIEDIAVRYHRMQGKAALLLPGADHAGFETQVVYERRLAAEGKSRFDFSREELYQQIWDFVAQNKENYESQFRRLGASVDWSRYTFTLDEKVVKQAYATFKQMWDEGLIYRGERLVNFCTFHGTSFADIEVEHKEVAGHLWHIRYPLTDGSGEVVVATTRPETMLGDVAVAVHPDDKRYKDYVGKTVKLPLTAREIPVIADEFVDSTFGTGAVKITPAHDPNDYEAGLRHDLPMITVIDHHGNINHEAPQPYQGLSVTEAREAVVKDLTDTGFLVKTEEHTHNVGHCYKCGTIIQPLLRQQWFIAMERLAKDAIKALREEQIVFHPDSKRQQLITYLKGLRDWNISRQIAWGIPIPAFQSLDDPEDWVYDERVEEEIIEVAGKRYRRDPDVFDTWFSSSSWPYATLDYPDGTDFKKFYPIDVMETGLDLLQPWVSRMIMFGLYVTKSVPFSTVYFHGMVLDEHGAKMSKSKGNVVNPMDKIDQYGSDALRLGLITGQSAGAPQPFTEAKLVGARNFCNKLWNVARFIEGKLGDEFNADAAPKPETEADHWILGRLDAVTREVTELMEAYRFSEASELVYHLLWDDFADWYVESSKTSLNPSVLAHGLETILKLAHPFTPFVTETIWQTLHQSDDSLLITAPWPKSQKFDAKKAGVFEEIRAIVSEIRFIKGAMHLQNKMRLYHQEDAFIESHQALLKSLAGLSEVTSVADGQGLNLTSTTRHCWLDVDRESARSFVQKLSVKIVEAENTIKQLRGRLDNPSYTEKAPKQLVEQTKQQLAEAEALLQKLQSEHQRFSNN